MSGDGNIADSCRRKALKIAVSALCTEHGFSHAEDAALETLTEMIQSFITELGRSSKAYAELSCRTEPIVSDVSMALIEMGQDIQSLAKHSKRPGKTVMRPPGHSLPTPNPRTLQAGTRQSHLSHIPDYLPPFPDPHTYIKTATFKKPTSEYQMIREKAASQKRDVERALTKFIAKTGDTENLFQDDPYAFPLVECRPKTLPYLDALLPKGQDVESQEEEIKLRKKRKARELDNNDKDGAKPLDAVPGGVPAEGMSQDSNTNRVLPPVSQNEAASEVDGVIDNPYLREIKMPKFRNVGKKKTYY